LEGLKSLVWFKEENTQLETKNSSQMQDKYALHGNEFKIRD
jgi:hypothetical protein